MALTTETRGVGSIAHLLGIVYDHLGRAVILNILWGLLSIPWFALAALLIQFSLVLGDSFQVPTAGAMGLVVAVFFCSFSPPTLLLLAATAPWVSGGESLSRQQLLRILRSRFLAVQCLGGAAGLSAALLLINAWFYHSIGGWFGAMLSGFMLWLVVALVFLSLYWLPLLAREPEAPVWPTLRRGLLLVFDKPAVAVYLIVSLGLLILLGIFSGVGWLCGLGTVAAVQVHLVLARILPEVDVAMPARRTLREVLRPWE